MIYQYRQKNIACMYLSKYRELVPLFSIIKRLGSFDKKTPCKFSRLRIRIHCNNADPESNFRRIRIQLLIKVMGIYDHRSTDPPGLHFEPPYVNCERSTALRVSIF
jgi:hypothetical protein